MNLFDIFRRRGPEQETAIAVQDVETARPMAHDEALEQELAYAHQAILGGIGIYSGLLNYNPDDLVGRKGLKIYWDMYNRDEDVRNSLDFITLAMLSSGYDIVPPDEETEPRAQTFTDKIRYDFDHMERSLIQALREIQIGRMRDGFNITEIVLRVIDSGPFAGLIGLKAMKGRTARDFDFDTDRHGNIKTMQEHGKNGLIQGLLTGNRRDLPPQKFIITQHNMEGSNHYGNSILRPAYRPYRMKDAFIKFWAVALERFGAPTPWAQVEEESNLGANQVGKRPVGISKSTRARVMKILKNLQSGTAVWVPRNIKLNKFEEVKGRAQFSDAIDKTSRMIQRATMMPATVQDEGRRAGSLALSKTHGQSLIWVLNFSHLTLADAINDQYIRRNIDINYPRPQAYPLLVFRPLGTEKQDRILEIVEKLAGIGTVNPKEKWIREQLDIPPEIEEEIDKARAREVEDREAEERREALKSSDVTQHLFAHVVPYLEGFLEPGDMPRHESMRSYVRDLELDTLGFAARDRRGRGATQPKPPANDLKITNLDRKLSEPEKRVNLSEIQREQEALVKATVNQLEDVMRDVKKWTLTRGREIAEKGGIQDIQKLTLPARLTSRFKKIMQNFYLLDFVNGYRQAVKEVQKGVGKNLKEGIKLDDSALVQFQAISPEEALENFIRKIPILRRRLPIYDRRAFTVTAVEKERILFEIKRILEQGIGRGTSVKGIMGALEDTFRKYVATGEEVAGELLTPHRLETIVRTNLSEAFNSGRLAAFEDPDIKQFVQAYQYSAIIDPRTTEFCERHDLFTRPITDPVWDTIWPPNHFNCRSIIVPVVTGDTWTRTADKPGIGPQEGFRI